MSESEEVGVGVGESPQAPSKVETGRNVPSLLGWGNVFLVLMLNP